MKKIKRILIANRGEIAVRIMRTAHAMGIKCVAVRTAAEPNALYLSSADLIHDEVDETAEIPVFLDIDKLIYHCPGNKVRCPASGIRLSCRERILCRSVQG